jgi:hypothetical protein|tara:strand:+ start:3664 stop:6006 length:2343 start_codon:yes stop_codon:yes gene_type:complete
MSIRISDPLFLLSAQTGLSATELVAGAAAGNPDLEKPQEALKTGEPIPILFARRRNSNGGVMVQPKMTEAFFSNTIVEKDISTDGGTVVAKVPFERIQLKYLLVLSEGDLPQIQIRDLFHGTCRHGTFNQVFDDRAGTWNPGNDMYDFFTFTASLNASNVYAFDISTLTTGQSVNYPDGTRYYYRSSDNTTYQLKRKDHGFPVFCGTSGSYSGLTTLSFERTFDDVDSETLRKTLNVFIREGLQVTRLVDSTSGPSDNYVDLVKYLFQTNNRLADDLIDNTALTTAAKFVDANTFLFNGAITQSQNLLDWLQDTSVNFLLRVTNTNGKFGMQPRLPYNTDHTIKTTQVTPEFTFTEQHVVEGGFEIEYISLEDREPVCFVVQWRQQPEANFGLVRTVEVRYTGEAASGPFMNIDMSNYCTNENHAVKVGTFRLAQRKFITHHLRLTVREQNYNSTLVVGDLVRVRLRRETSEGAVEHHDKLYEINRIEKTFTSTITYDLTHFPIDSQGRSIVARQVAAATGAGNTIDVGRSDFDCDENSSTDTTLIGTSSGGGGTAPSTGDTGFNIPTPSDTDSSYPDGENNPDDPLDAPEPQRLITGYSGTPGTGDTLSFDPGCPNPLIKWYKININTGNATFIGSGISATLEVTEALQTEGVRVYGEGCCPDPSQPGGYAVCKKSDEVDIFDEILDCPGGGDAGNQGTFTKVINVGTAFPASFNFRYTAFVVPDRFVISGAASLDTGFVSGTNVNVTVQKTSADPYITVTVFAPTAGTAWNYDVGCAS